jgi:hypothetical protein
MSNKRVRTTMHSHGKFRGAGDPEFQMKVHHTGRGLGRTFERQYLHNQIAEEQAELMRLELEAER